MTGTPSPTTSPDQPPIYQVRIEGQLDPQWTDWFDGLSIIPGEAGETLITGPLPDQAALHGLFKKLRDLGLTLLSVNRVQCKDIHQNRSDKEQK